MMGWRDFDDYGWRPYVSVGQKLAKAEKHAAGVAKKQGRQLSPVKGVGRKIVTTFWGKAWCDNLTAYSDYANRLPRGATYVRNGSVVDLMIKPRKVEAIVAGSETYTVTIEIAPLSNSTWTAIKENCSAAIDSLLDLLAGRFSDGVMQRLTHQKEGLFPAPNEIKMFCSCPDRAGCCKHLAAVMYGIGARLDSQPELLFMLRNVDHQELVSQAVAKENLEKELATATDESLAGQDLGAIFGIDLDTIASSAVEIDVSSISTAAIAVPKRRTGVKASPKKKSTLKVDSDDTVNRSPKSRKPVQSGVGGKQAAKKTLTKNIIATAERAHATKSAKKKSVAKKRSAKRSALKQS